MFTNTGGFPVLGVRVYPPHEWQSVFVPFETTCCSLDMPGNYQLTVRTVIEGAGRI